MNGNWYSNGLSAEEVANFITGQARIERPRFRVAEHGDNLELAFTLKYNSIEANDYALAFWDVLELFHRTGARETRDLAGKVVTCHKEGLYVHCISVSASNKK